MGNEESGASKTGKKKQQHQSNVLERSPNESIEDTAQIDLSSLSLKEEINNEDEKLKIDEIRNENSTSWKKVKKKVR